MGRRLIDDISEWMTKYKKNSVKQSTYDRLETSFFCYTDMVEWQTQQT